MDRSVVLLQIINELAAAFDKEEADRLARFLLEDLVGFDPVISVEMLKVVEIATKKLIRGEPLQYVTNLAHFYGYEYYVDPAVLIPRPETEELIYQVLQYAKSINKEHPRIIDIGTGSGCIPITIKKENARCEIAAVDVSNEALRVAIHNANALGTPITFYYCNVLSDRVATPAKPFDIIVSNPPYIPTSELSVMGDSVVQHEPHLALFTDDENGLVFYQRIADLTDDWLADDGAVFLELNEYHALKIKDIYMRNGSFTSVEIINDMQGKPRILKAIR